MIGILEAVHAWIQLFLDAFLVGLQPYKPQADTTYM